MARAAAAVAVSAARRPSSSSGAASCPFTQFEHARWEGAVSPYDRIFGRLTAQAARHVVDRALKAPAPLGHGLDCATGPGYVVEEALRRGVLGSKLVGADFSAGMLRRARERVQDPGVAWVEADIQETPLAGEEPGRRGGFAWCACNFGVLHLARPEAFFAAARQALRPSGLLLFTVWADLARSPAFQIPLRALEEHGSADVGLPPGPPFFKYSDPETARAALEEAGFDPPTIVTELVEMTWTLDRPEDLWEVFLEGTARTGGMLERQRPEAKARIEAAMREAVLAAQPAERTGPPYELAQPCLLVSARAPAEAQPAAL